MADAWERHIRKEMVALVLIYDIVVLGAQTRTQASLHDSAHLSIPGGQLWHINPSTLHVAGSRRSENTRAGENHGLGGGERASGGPAAARQPGAPCRSVGFQLKTLVQAAASVLLCGPAHDPHPLGVSREQM